MNSPGRPGQPRPPTAGAESRWSRHMRGMGVSRRALLAVAAALVVGAVAGALVVGGRGSSPASRRTATANALTGALSANPTTHGPLGVSVAQPRGWQVTERSGVIEMLSPDQTASLTVSAPQPAGHEAQLRRSDKRQLLVLFKPARILGHRRGKIGGQPVLTTELVGVTPKHRHIRILTTAVSSAYRTYSIQVFSTPRPAALRLLQIRSALASFRFFAPGK